MHGKSHTIQQIIQTIWNTKTSHCTRRNPHNLSDNGLKHEVTIYVIEGHQLKPLGRVDATALGSKCHTIWQDPSTLNSIIKPANEQLQRSKYQH